MLTKRMMVDVDLWSSNILGSYVGGGQGGGNPGVMGAGGLREAGEERTGGGISEKGGSWEKWKKFCNTGTIFCNRKSTRRRELLRKGAGTGSAGCERREIQTPLPPPPPPHSYVTYVLHTA